MKETESKSFSRRTVAHVSVLGTTQLHLRSPVVIAAWSVLFPGLGHLLLSKYLRGFLLFIWEIVINYKAKINLLILYSFLGDFQRAKEVVDIQWMSLYIPLYLFAIWDSYRTTVDLNHTYILAAREDAEVSPFQMSSLEINYLDKREPWASVAWSILIPGSGQLYIHRLVTAFFVMVWWIFIGYESKLLPVLHYTLLGDFSQAKAAANMQWLLNIPSLYFFAMYDSYVNTVESNKLYDWEQARFLKRSYEPQNFVMPSKKNIKGDKMHIISTFEHSKYLELAITSLEMLGVSKENILAVAMDKKGEKRKYFDTIHSADGLSLLDLSIILSAFFGIFGGVYGFILEWGPLLWGLIGILVGGLLGFIVKMYTTKKYGDRQSDKRGAEVVLIIECNSNQLQMIKDILWEHKALGVRKLDLDRT